MPVPQKPSEIQRLKQRAQTMARVEKISPTAAHDLVAQEIGFLNWSMLVRKSKSLVSQSINVKPPSYAQTPLSTIREIIGHRQLTMTFFYANRPKNITLNELRSLKISELMESGIPKLEVVHPISPDKP